MSTYRSSIFCMALTIVTSQVLGMNLGEEKETNITVASKTLIGTVKKEEDKSSTITWDPIPRVLLQYMFGFLDVPDLGKISQVSKIWQSVASQPSLWKKLGLRKYGEYLTEEDLQGNPRENVIFYFLSIQANALNNLKEITRLVRYYRLDGYRPSFKKNCPFMHANGLALDLDRLEGLKQEDKAEFIAQGNKSAIDEEVKWVLKDLQASRDLNELLIEQEDAEAIKRKIEALWHGGDTYSIVKRIPPNGLDYPGSEKKSPYETHREKYSTFGYAKNPVGAMEFIEKLIKQGSQWATELKIEGLADGKYGYEKNPTAAKELNDILIEKGDQAAISRKIKGLAEGEYGYEKNPTAAKELNDILIEKGDQAAINRKIEGLAEGEYGYEGNLVEAKHFNESLIMAGNLEAKNRKLKNLTRSRSRPYVNQIQKIYKQDPEEARNFIEHGYIEDNNPIVRGIGHYLKVLGLKYGLFGYKKNREQAIEYIKKYNVPF